jgi:hypothetical protein
MASDLFEDDQELTPEEAFLYSLDDAIRATIQCLGSAGVNEEAIWSAFRSAVNTLHRATADVDASELTERYPRAAAAA